MITVKEIKHRSAGIVIVHRVAEGWHYLVLRAYRNWDFPKGVVEPSETPQHHQYRWVTYKEAKSLLPPRLLPVLEWAQAKLG